MSLRRRASAEGIGTAYLLVAVVGSGIMAERLAGGNVGVALLANTVATAATLFALITAFAAVSGAHFNPVVTVLAGTRGDIRWGEAGVCILSQLFGGILGIAVAHWMFERPAFEVSHHVRAGLGQVLGETVATFGLVLVIGRCRELRPVVVAACVASYITGAYWFTSSTSFANPVVTIARALSDSFAGIRPSDVPGFVGGQLVGGLLAIATLRWFPTESTR